MHLVDCRINYNVDFHDFTIENSIEKCLTECYIYHYLHTDIFLDECGLDFCEF